MTNSPPRIASTAELRDLGIGKGRLYGPRFAPLFHGVHRQTTMDVSPLETASAYQRLCASDSVISHATAARFYGLPVPDDHRIHVLRPAGSPRSRRPQVVTHRGNLLDRPVVLRDGSIVVGPRDLVLQLATCLDRTRLFMALDAMLREPPARGTPKPRLTGADLIELADRAHGRRSVCTLRELTPWARSGVESPAESKIRLEILDAGFVEPEANVVVVNPGGRPRSYRLDMAWRSLGVALEYHGQYHFAREEQRLDDYRRENRLRELGWDLRILTRRDYASPAPMLSWLAQRIPMRTG